MAKKKEKEWIRVQFIKDSRDPEVPQKPKFPPEADREIVKTETIEVRITPAGNVSSTKHSPHNQQWRADPCNLAVLKLWGYEESGTPPDWAPPRLHIDVGGVLDRRHWTPRYSRYSWSRPSTKDYDYIYLEEMSPGLREHLQGIATGLRNEAEKRDEAARRAKRRKKHTSRAEKRWQVARKQLGDLIKGERTEESAAAAARGAHRSYHAWRKKVCEAQIRWPADLSKTALGDAGAIGELILAGLDVE